MKASIARICWCALNHPSFVKCFEVGKCGGQFGRVGLLLIINLSTTCSYPIFHVVCLCLLLILVWFCMKLKGPLFEMGVGMLEIIVTISILTILAGLVVYNSTFGMIPRSLRIITPLHRHYLPTNQSTPTWKPCCYRQVWESRSWVILATHLVPISYLECHRRHSTRHSLLDDATESLPGDVAWNLVEVVIVSLVSSKNHRRWVSVLHPLNFVLWNRSSERNWHLAQAIRAKLESHKALKNSSSGFQH